MPNAVYFFTLFVLIIWIARHYYCIGSCS